MQECVERFQRLYGNVVAFFGGLLRTIAVRAGVLVAWFRRSLIRSIISILLVLFGIPGSYIGIVALWKQVTDQEVRIGFNTIDRCRAGNLYEMKEDGTFPKWLRLGENAEQLSICDGTALTTEKYNLPGAIAIKYPGCVRFDDEENRLYLVFNPSAVCRISTKVHENAVYFCDGADTEARTEQVAQQIVNRIEDLPVCKKSFFEEANVPGLKLEN